MRRPVPLLLAASLALAAPSAASAADVRTTLSGYTLSSFSPLPDGSIVFNNNGETVGRVYPDRSVTTFAGTPNARGDTGDGGPAKSALTQDVGSVGSTPDGSVIFEESFVWHVRRVSPSGVISTVAGRGLEGPGCPAAKTSLDAAGALTGLPDGGFLMIAPGRIDRVFPDGRLSTIAGQPDWLYGWDGSPGDQLGDGGSAAKAVFAGPYDLSLSADGGYLVADGGRIRKIWPDGKITTIAGDGQHGDPQAGVGHPATEAHFNDVFLSVAGTSDGGYLIADPRANRVFRVGPDGILRDFMGNGTQDG